MKIPHMGWNSVGDRKAVAHIRRRRRRLLLLFRPLLLSRRRRSPSRPRLPITAGGSPLRMQKENIFACQFHPEKSQAIGLKLLRNFVTLMRVARPIVLPCSFCSSALPAGASPSGFTWSGSQDTDDERLSRLPPGDRAGRHPRECGDRASRPSSAGASRKGHHYTRRTGETSYLNVLVYRFQERRGGNFSVERPASVGYHVHLFDQDGLLKVFVFDETQQPLSENIFALLHFPAGGGRSGSLRSELAREGVEKAVDSYRAMSLKPPARRKGNEDTLCHGPHQAGASSGSSGATSSR